MRVRVEVTPGLELGVRIESHDLSLTGALIFTLLCVQIQFLWRQPMYTTTWYAKANWSKMIYRGTKETGGPTDGVQHRTRRTN